MAIASGKPVGKDCNSVGKDSRQWDSLEGVMTEGT